jgi:ankyrin repeat protein
MRVILIYACKETNMTGESKLNQDLIDRFVGVCHGDFDTVKTLLAEYPELINANASWGETGIEAAAQTGRSDIAGYLLKAGAPLDICTAAMLGQTQKVEAFLAADPDLARSTGAHDLPLLYFPVIVGNQRIAQILLDHGAQINAGQGGTTPLHGAVLFNQVHMVAWLLEHGAHQHVQDYNNKTPLQLAVENGKHEIAGLLSD